MTHRQANETKWEAAIRSLIRHCAFLLASLSATMWALTAVCGISCQPTQNTFLRVELGRMDAHYQLSWDQTVHYGGSRLSLSTSDLDHWNPSRAVWWNQRSWWILRHDNFYTASDGSFDSSISLSVPLWIPLLISTFVYCFLAFPHLRRTRHVLRGKCSHCGYDLRHLPHNRCSECGSTFNAAGIDDAIQRTRQRIRKPIGLLGKCTFVTALTGLVLAIIGWGIGWPGTDYDFGPGRLFLREGMAVLQSDSPDYTCKWYPDGNCGGGHFSCSTVGVIFDATRWATWDSPHLWGVQFPLWLPAGTCTALLFILSGRAILLTFILRRAIARDSDSITAPQENPHTKSSPHRFHKRLINLLPWHGYGLAAILLLVLPASYWSYTRYDQYWDQRLNFDADPIKEFHKWFPSIAGDNWDHDINDGLMRLLSTSQELRSHMAHIYPTLTSQEQEDFIYLLSNTMFYCGHSGVTSSAHTSKDALLPLIMIAMKHESLGDFIVSDLAFYDIPGRKDILQSFIANPQTKPDMLESALYAYLYNYDADDIEDDLNRLLLGPLQINVAVQLLKPKSAGPWRDRALQLVHDLIRQYPHSTTIFEMLNQHYDTCGDNAMAQHAMHLLDTSPLNMSLAPTRNETQEPNCLTPHQARLTTTDIQILLEYLIDCSDD